MLSLFVLSGCHHRKKPAEVEVTPSVEESSLAADFERNVGDRVFFALNKSDISRKAEERVEIARKMLSQGCNFFLISSVTGLEEDFIRSLS